MRPISDQTAYLKRFTIIESTTSWTHTNRSATEYTIFRATDAELVNANWFAVAVQLGNQFVCLP